MKIVLIAGVALLLLGGGAGAAYMFLNKPAEAAAGDMSAEAIKAEEEAKAAAQTPLVEPIYVQLNPLVLPIVDDNGVTQTVSMVIMIEVPDDIAATSVKNMQPRLQDAFIQDMYGALSRKAVMKGGVIEVAKIKDRLNAISHKVAGPNLIKEVLLQVVQQRRI